MSLERIPIMLSQFISIINVNSYIHGTTEVCLTLYNDIHVQQAMALVYQHPELSEVLKLQMQVTEGQEPVGEPQQLDPVV